MMKTVFRVFSFLFIPFSLSLWGIILQICITSMICVTIIANIIMRKAYRNISDTKTDVPEASSTEIKWI